MVFVPPGCFWMGSSDMEIAIHSAQYPEYMTEFADQGPQTRICFDSGFWIDKYLVTNAQFRQFNGTSYRSSLWGGDSRPRERINWFEAKNFCELRGARLPTEAEWEYAARGPLSLAYPWGNMWDPNNSVWSDFSGLHYPVDPTRQTANVGTKPGGASWVGALDMAGNVWEWTNSLYQSYPYDKSDGRENEDDMDSDRVIRGGSWVQGDIEHLSANRISTAPFTADSDLGFRCVRSSD